MGSIVSQPHHKNLSMGSNDDVEIKNTEIYLLIYLYEDYHYHKNKRHLLISYIEKIKASCKFHKLANSHDRLVNGLTTLSWPPGDISRALWALDPIGLFLFFSEYFVSRNSRASLL